MKLNSAQILVKLVYQFEILTLCLFIIIIDHFWLQTIVSHCNCHKAKLNQRLVPFERCMFLYCRAIPKSGNFFPVFKCDNCKNFENLQVTSSKRYSSKWYYIFVFKPYLWGTCKLAVSAFTLCIGCTHNLQIIIGTISNRVWYAKLKLILKLVAFNIASILLFIPIINQWSMCMHFRYDKWICIFGITHVKADIRLKPSSKCHIISLSGEWYRIPLEVHLSNILWTCHCWWPWHSGVFMGIAFKLYMIL